MLPIFIRDYAALNSLMKTPSAVRICEPRCHDDKLGSPCTALRSTVEDPPLSKGHLSLDAGVSVSHRGHCWGQPAPPGGGDIRL